MTETLIPAAPEVVTVARAPEPGTCDPWLISEGPRPAHTAVLYSFTDHRPDGGFETRLRCWRHRPAWALDVRKPRG